jgi:hypothetical protein
LALVALAVLMLLQETMAAILCLVPLHLQVAAAVLVMPSGTLRQAVRVAVVLVRLILRVLVEPLTKVTQVVMVTSTQTMAVAVAVAQGK